MILSILRRIHLPPQPQPYLSPYHHHHHHPTLFLLPQHNLQHHNTYSIVETSRNIEERMKEQRFKNIRNKFSAINTTFGLIRPILINPNPTKPETFEYTIESLRLCSHRYPEYLLNELSNRQSEFYPIIEDIITSLINAEKEPTLEFLAFMICWKIHEIVPEYAEIVIRKIYNLELEFEEIFELLKCSIKTEEQLKRQLSSLLENKILEKLKNLEREDFHGLFKILNLIRLEDLQPTSTSEGLSFFTIVEQTLISTLPTMPLPNLVELIIHYANNAKESQDSKLEILTAAEPLLITNLKFINYSEMISTIYSYLRVGMGSESLLKTFVERVDLLYYDIPWPEKKIIMKMSSMFPYDLRKVLVANSQQEFFQGRRILQSADKNKDQAEGTVSTYVDVEYQLLPIIYLCSYECNLLTKELIVKLQSKILENIFNYQPEEVALVSWLFVVTPKGLANNNSLEVLFGKLETIIEGGFIQSTFTLKQVATIVWALCSNTHHPTIDNTSTSNTNYKETSPFWENIEHYIQENLNQPQPPSEQLESISSILWAYNNNRALTFKTLAIITNTLLTLTTPEHNFIPELELSGFELTSIMSYYYSIMDNTFPSSIIQHIKLTCIKHFESIINDLSINEIIKCLKTICTDNYDPECKLTDNGWKSIVEILDNDIEQIEYEWIVAVVKFVLASPLVAERNHKAIGLVIRLMERKKRLEQLQNITIEEELE